MATWAVSFVLILTRVGAFVALLPQFGGVRVPRMVKVGLAVALAVLWFGSFGPPLEALQDEGPGPSWPALILAVGREMVLGGVLGYACGLLLVPARVAGEFVAQEMGLTLGAIADPTSGASGAVLTQLFEAAAVALFFTLDIHHVFLAALHATFERWPVGGGLGALPVGRLVDGAAAAQEWGVLLAMPLLACLLLTTVVLGLLTRAAPQMNLFSVGFALRVGVGLCAAYLLLPELGAALVGILGRLGEVVLP
jgi:flagellar biosynthetic protein FliR